jgi:hypothetical protein
VGFPSFPASARLTSDGGTAPKRAERAEDSSCLRLGAFVV